jgi:hypothetical protein
MNRDEIEGKAETLKGRVKQAAGDLTNNPDLHDEGVLSNNSIEPSRRHSDLFVDEGLIREIEQY